MFIEQPPWLLRFIYPTALWRMDRNEKKVYLTFDDGPIPVVTPWVVELLEKYQIKATFFMVGDNVHKHPAEFDLVKSHGHRLGNHTFNHLRGVDYSSEYYLDNIDRADELIHSNLFRPPHGFMRTVQYKTTYKHYQIVMWDVVTRDYSSWLTGTEVFDKVKRYVRNGSIITFHDSLKSWQNGNLQYALPRSIDWLLEKGYTFGVIA